MAAAAQVAFARVRTMNKTSIASVDTIGACQQTINSLVPFFAGLDALAGTGDEGPDPAVVDHVFDVLAQIGHDQARGEGLFSRPDLRPEAPFIATLKSPAFSDAYAGRANLDKLADAGKMISSLHSLTELLTADKPAKATGDLFSVVANDRIKDIRKNKSPDHELVGIYEKVRDEFIALCGDRRVGEYRRKDLQHYVNEISWLPPEASSEKDFSYKDVVRHIQQNKLAGGRGLAAKTIRDGRLSYIRALIALGCEDADIHNPIAKSKVEIPDRAPLSIARIAPDGKAFERVWRAGIASGVLSDALLPPLALLAGRRVGVRPGRMQERVSVLPAETEPEVTALLRFYLKDTLADVEVAKLARLGVGSTPAMVEGWVKEGRAAARAAGRALQLVDVLEQMLPRDDRSPEDIRTIARHEIGHAIVAHRLGFKVERVTIIAGNGSGGHTKAALNSVVPTWERICDIVTLSLGGRAADIVLGSGANAGAENDLANATAILLNAIERQGLRGSLVHRSDLGSRRSEIMELVDAQLKTLLRRAIAVIEDDRKLASKLAERLIVERILSGADVASMLDARAAPSVLPKRRSRTMGRKERHGLIHP